MAPDKKSKNEDAPQHSTREHKERHKHPEGDRARVEPRSDKKAGKGDKEGKSKIDPDLSKPVHPTQDVTDPESKQR